MQTNSFAVIDCSEVRYIDDCSNREHIESRNHASEASKQG